MFTERCGSDNKTGRMIQRPILIRDSPWPTHGSRRREDSTRLSLDHRLLTVRHFLDVVPRPRKNIEVPRPRTHANRRTLLLTTRDSCPRDRPPCPPSDAPSSPSTACPSAVDGKAWTGTNEDRFLRFYRGFCGSLERRN